MTFTITLGWWLLPLAITVIMPVVTIWRTEVTSARDGFGVPVLGMLTALIWTLISVATILGAWLIWSLLA